MSLIQQWGNAAWFLFHTLSYKLKDEYNTPNEIANLRKILINICFNLPCPVCSEHAKNKINQVNLNEISSKEILMRFFYELHNTINHDLNKSIYSYDEFKNKYGQANTGAIVSYFIQIFRNINAGNFKIIMTKISTDSSIDLLITYLNNNAYKFNP
jgi:hypothetical protein